MARALVISPGESFVPKPGGQTRLWQDRTSRFVWVEGGWGCIAPETTIDVPGVGPTRVDVLSALGAPIEVWAYEQSGPVRRWASCPFVKAFGPYALVEFDDGRFMRVGLDHRFLTDSGWIYARDLIGGLRPRFVSCLPGSSSESCRSTHAEDDRRSLRTVEGSQSGCSFDRRLCGLRSIRLCGYGPIYDLHVPGPNNYVAQGLVHHNSGKTFAGAHKFLDVHLYNAVSADGRLTGVPSAVIAPTSKGLNDFMVPALLAAHETFGLTVVRRKSIRVGNETLDDVLYLPDLSTPTAASYIMLRTAERPELITGWQVGAGWGDEITRWREDWINPRNDPLIQVIGRVRHKAAKIHYRQFTYTPEGDATRAHEWSRRGMDHSALYQLSTRDNDAMAQYVTDLESALTADQAKQYIDGEPMRMRGAAAYTPFDEAHHVVESIAWREGLPFDMAFDFNINPGNHVLIGQYLPHEDMFHVIDEIHEMRLSLEGALDIAFAKHGLRMRASRVRVYGDASGSSAWSGTGQTQYQIIQKRLSEMGIAYEINVPPSNPPIVDRVNCVCQALADGKGKHVRVAKRCARLITDLRRQKWDQNGKLTTENKTIGHAGDALGYWVVDERPIRIERPSTSHATFGVV